MQYIRYFLLTALPVILLFAVLSFMFPPITGDLTRLGNYSENEYGWNEPLPEILVEGDIGSDDPDIIVMGDSFSDRLVWQSVVMRERGGKILTFDWVRPGSLDEWVVSLKARYPSAKCLIIETVERAAVHRFTERQDGLSVHDDNPVRVLSYWTQSLRDTSFVHPMHDPVYAFSAMLNTFKPISGKQRNGQTMVAPLSRKGLFSSRRSDVLLYYHDDELKQGWSSSEVATAVAHMKRLAETAEKHGLHLIVMVVPDKSTAYRNYFMVPQFEPQPPDIWAEMERQGVPQIELKSTISAAVEKTRDLYLPDDTHFSAHGYIVMGRKVAEFLDGYCSR